MRVNPVRLIAAIFALAIVLVAAGVIVNGLMTNAIISGVRNQDLPAVNRLLRIRPSLASTRVMPQGSTSNKVQWLGAFVVHDAVRSGEVAIAEALAAHGADLAVRVEGDTLLHLAAHHGHLDMMRWLVQKGADPNVRNTCAGCEHEGRMPLHAVQQFRDGEGSALLLSLGADINAADAAGRTPLHASATFGSSSGAMVLCAHGADVTRRDRSGRTPHEIAVATGTARRGSHSAETLPGELAGWLEPGGGCQQLAARARPGHPASEAEMVEIWRNYACARDPSLCAN